MADDDSFFSRWSRRKQQVRTGAPLPAEPPPPAPAPVPVAARPVSPPAPVAAAPAATAAPVPAAEDRPPPPTLDDVAELTPQSDFSRFVARDVSPDVRNAAVKKLFADPHFNVMDGLDIYIDDYTQPSPLSKADMARMVGAQFLKLVDDPNEKKAPAPQADAPVAAASAPDADTPPDGGTTAATPGEPTAAELPPPHDDHADLQLQPDHAPERERSGPGAG